MPIDIKSWWRSFWSSTTAENDAPASQATTATDELVARRLTRYYLTALTVIAVLSLAGLWLINNAIRYHESDSYVLNVSGRQRMLSQKLTKMALVNVFDPARYDRPSYDSTLYRWQVSHEQLKTGILGAGENHFIKKSKAIDEKFDVIEPAYQALLFSFGALARESDEEKRVGHLHDILEAEPVFLKEMEEIVVLFEVESRQRLEELRRIKYIVVTISLLTLLLEALLIFAPIVRYTRQIIRELSESKEALYLANQKLKETNESLFRSQNEVLRLQEARHQQVRMEDQIKAAALLEGQEEERKRLSRELHDGVGQMLTGLKLLVGRLKKTPADSPVYRSRLDEVSQLIQETIVATRQVSHNVMPDALVDYGLAAALQALAGQLGKAAASELTFSLSGTPARLQPAQEIGLYRIAQEALVNALKHSRAGHIRIMLQYRSHSVNLEISDDGGGFDAEKIVDWQQSGLENMQTRARLMAADFSLKSEPEKGTSVLVTLKLDEAPCL